MPKFRYYIADTMDGCIKGTNDEAIAKSYAGVCEAFVVDIETNQWLMEDETSQDVPETKS